jgi:hypothetical protein
MPDVDGVDWLMFLHALPALALMACFTVAARNLDKNARRAMRLLAIATLGTITLAAVEIGIGFYNLRIGEKHIYINWLWYIDKIGPDRGDELVYGYIGSNGETVYWGKDGYINRSGEVVIPPRFTAARRFSEGLAAVRDENHTSHPFGELSLNTGLANRAAFITTITAGNRFMAVSFCE